MFDTKVIGEKLSWDYVFSKVSQEEVFERYLGIRVVFGRLIKSPDILRGKPDKNPTASFKYFNGKLFFADWNGSFRGNCVDLVMYLEQCSFVDALESICETFNLKEATDRKPNIRISDSVLKELQAEDIYHSNKMELVEEDVEYFKQHGISLETLNRFGVKSLKTLWKNRNVYWVRTKNDPAVIYNSKWGFKVYFYTRKSYRFHSSGAYIQGLEHLRFQSDVCIITKSKKDLMFISQCGIDAVAPASENTYIPNEIMQYLLCRYKKVCVFFDPDDGGKMGANYYKVNYGLPNVTSDIAKDITDVVKKTTPEFAKNHLFNLINSIQWE